MEEKPQQGISWDEAVQMAKRSEDLFNKGDIETILTRYADDVVIRFSGIPEIRGKAGAEKFLRARFARELEYKVKKTTFMVSGLKIGGIYTNSFLDAKTGKRMVGRGLELWEYRDGKLALWEAALNIWEEGTDMAGTFL